MQWIKSLRLIISVHTYIIIVLSILSTYLCRKFGITADFPLSLIGTAIVFPIVFSIGGAYKRRENALKEYGNMKAHGRAIFFASRDWIADSDTELQENTKKALAAVLIACRNMFITPVKEMEPEEKAVYEKFSELSKFINSFRAKGLAGGEVSRCNQFLSKMVVAFENVKHIYQYRTPRTLRTFSKVFIYVLPIMYGPYFAEISQDFSQGSVHFTAYMMPVLFTIVLVSLDNIQTHLENPFDQVGEDDIVINAEKFVSRL
ncbi:MAG: hypothetical protein K9M75_06740 [Phycisphaerae bacterium]|nr:hypothetical protein [Phycisphaerae bacterium]